MGALPWNRVYRAMVRVESFVDVSRTVDPHLGYIDFYYEVGSRVGIKKGALVDEF